jgi:hypothetical protein
VWGLLWGDVRSVAQLARHQSTDMPDWLLGVGSWELPKWIATQSQLQNLHTCIAYHAVVLQALDTKWSKVHSCTMCP